jgi:uncharacterized protein
MTDQPNYEVSNEDKLWALLAYVIVVIGPIIILLIEDKKKRPFLREHTFQALVLGVLIFVISWIPILGWILSFLGWIAAIYFGIQAYNGKLVTIPVITDFVKKQGWS